jgi:hypothetical protein
MEVSEASKEGDAVDGTAGRTAATGSSARPCPTGQAKRSSLTARRVCSGLASTLEINKHSKAAAQAGVVLAGCCRETADLLPRFQTQTFTKATHANAKLSEKITWISERCNDERIVNCVFPTRKR